MFESRPEAADRMTIIATLSQTAGRGQGDHRWYSAAGESLTFSILKRFDPGELAARDCPRINSLVTPVITGFLETEGVGGVWVKPPNDIWVKDRKICGILIENVLNGEWIDVSIIGIGLNLNTTSFPADLPNPVSLKMLTGRDYEPHEVLRRLAGEFSRRL